MCEYVWLAIQTISKQYEYLQNEYGMLWQSEWYVMRPIPKYSEFKINRLGVVVDQIKQIVVEPTLNTTGYYTITARMDGMNRSYSTYLHRLLALAFLPTTGDISKLQVNHKNGVKTDNRVENLEWVTQQINCQHAYRTGLRNDNIRIQLLNIVTGEKIEAYSQAEASRVLGVHPARLCEKIKRLVSNREPYRGYLISYV